MGTWKVSMVACVVVCYATLAWAELVASQNPLDLGTLKEDAESATASVILENGSSTQGVSVMQVKTSCGCTSASLEKEKLGPGERTSLTVTLNSNNMSGRFSKDVVLLYKEDESSVQPSVLNLSIIGFAPPKRYCSLRTVDFGSVYRDKLAAKTIGLDDLPEKAELIGIRVNDPLLIVQAVKQSGSGSYGLEIGFRPDLPYGSHKTGFTILTASEKYPEVRVPVHVTLVPPKLFYPDKLYCSPDSSGCAVKLMVPEGSVVDNVVLKDVPEGLTYEIHKDLNGSVIELAFGCRGGGAKPQAGSLTVNFTLNGEKTTRTIPYYIRNATS